MFEININACYNADRFMWFDEYLKVIIYVWLF